MLNSTVKLRYNEIAYDVYSIVKYSNVRFRVLRYRIWMVVAIISLGHGVLDFTDPLSAL